MNNLAIVTQENPLEIQLRQTSMSLCEAADNVIIMSRIDLSDATDLVKTIKVRTKEIEEERTKLVKPFNDGVKAINARFKAMTAPLEEAESAVKQKMLSFQKEEERRAREEQEKAEKIRAELEAKKRKEEEEAANDPTLDRPLLPPLPTMPVQEVAIQSTHRPTTYGQTGAVSTVKKVWGFEVKDIAALAAAHPNLVLANEVEINRIIRGKGGEIAGLHIFEKEIIQVR
jgi:hypothetical protein